MQWAAVFLGVAIVAATLCFGGVAGSAAGIAQVLFVLFLVVFLFTLIRRVIDHQYPSAR